MRRRRLRVALAPIEIAGYYARLADGLDKLGVDCALLTIVPHRFGYATKPPRSRIARAALAGARRTYPGSFKGLVKYGVLPVNLACRVVVVAHALYSYDAFVFSTGQSLLASAELPLLRLFGKRTVFVFHGSDSRPPYINGAMVRNAGDDPGPNLVRETARIKRKLKRIARFADAIIDNPLSAHLQERAFVNWFRVSIPHDAQDTPEPAAGGNGARPLRVVHAPSNPEAKGSALIEAAVERARERGHRIDFIQLRGRPNAEVLEELVRCDFVIDELYSDVPGAGLAYEAASFGRPTIVGGYGPAFLQRWVPPGMALPTHFIHPAQLDEAIDLMCRDEEYRRALGRRAQRFLREMCSVEAVAGRLLQVIEGRDIEDWMVEPSEITYLHGMGLTEEKARAAIRAVVEHASVQALGVGPELARAFAEFAYEDATDRSSKCT